MEQTKAYFKNIIPISGIIFSVITAVVLLQKDATINLGFCTTSDTLCVIVANIGLIICLGLIVALALFVVIVLYEGIFLLFRNGYSKFRHFFQLILASVSSSRKSGAHQRRYDDINLSEIRPDNPKNEIYFNILNDKSSPIVVKQMYFYKTDARWVQGEANWPHVYSKGNVEIDAKTCHTGRFLAEDDSQKTFSIIGYAPDKQDLNMTGFPIGIHKFDIKIVFALKDNLDHDLYKYFNILVTYKGSSQFHFDIKHRN